MSHWADAYVGLPFKTGGRARDAIDCWGLVRLVIGECCGILLPRYDDGDPVENMNLEASKLKSVLVGQQKEFDIVVMNTEVRKGLGWTFAPIHIGVMATSKLVLHIEDGSQSRLDRLDAMNVVMVVRP